MEEKTSHLKNMTALIIAVTALIAACSSFFKPRDDRATEASYETIGQSLKDLSDENERQHDDLVALRAYIDGVVHGAMPSSGAGYGTGTSTTPDAGASLDASSYVSRTSVPTLPTPVVARTLADPPVLAPRPRSVSPPSFAKVKKEADRL
jgi:hypothetical protein